MKKNKRWENNHQIIQDAYLQLIKDLEKIPTILQIAEKAQLSCNTVHKHLKSLQLSDITPKAKLRSERILEGLSKKAEEGDPSATKLYMQLVYGWTEKQIQEQMGKLEVINKNIDYSNLTKRQLQRLAAGENINMVLADIDDNS